MRASLATCTTELFKSEGIFPMMLPSIDKEQVRPGHYEIVPSP